MVHGQIKEWLKRSDWIGIGNWIVSSPPSPCLSEIETMDSPSRCGQFSKAKISLLKHCLNQPKRSCMKHIHTYHINYIISTAHPKDKIKGHISAQCTDIQGVVSLNSYKGRFSASDMCKLTQAGCLSTPCSSCSCCFAAWFARSSWRCCKYANTASSSSGNKKSSWCGNKTTRAQAVALKTQTQNNKTDTIGERNPRQELGDRGSQELPWPIERTPLPTHSLPSHAKTGIQCTPACVIAQVRTTSCQGGMVALHNQAHGFSSSTPPS